MNEQLGPKCRHHLHFKQNPLISSWLLIEFSAQKSLCLLLIRKGRQIIRKDLHNSAIILRTFSIIQGVNANLQLVQILPLVGIEC